MRIAALGDTHLGRALLGYDMTPAILRTMYAFHEMCVKRRVDVAVHLGDVFDRPTPSEYHRKVFVQWCNLFERSGISLRVLVGNHDAMAKAGAASALEAFKASQWRHVEMLDRPTTQGNLVYIPWPSASIYKDADWLEDVDSQRTGLRRGADAIVFAHLMPRGAVLGDQDWVYRGTEHTIPETLLADHRINLLIAGHVHRPQQVSKKMWTSGAAIRLRFDEARQQRYFLEIEDGRLRMVRHSHAPILRELVIDASAWGTGGSPPSTVEIVGSLPSVGAEIVKVVPYVDEATSVDWQEVEAGLYRAGAAHVHVATTINVKRQARKRKKVAKTTTLEGRVKRFMRERIADTKERRAVLRAFMQLRKQIQEKTDG